MVSQVVISLKDIDLTAMEQVLLLVVTGLSGYIVKLNTNLYNLSKKYIAAITTNTAKSTEMNIRIENLQDTCEAIRNNTTYGLNFRADHTRRVSEEHLQSDQGD